MIDLNEMLEIESNKLFDFEIIGTKEAINKLNEYYDTVYGIPEIDLNFNMVYDNLGVDDYEE